MITGTDCSMPMLVNVEPMPRMAMDAPLPLLPRPIDSCGVIASRSIRLSSP